MTDPRRTYRTLLAAVPHLLAAAPAGTLLAAASERLPDPIATHFGPSGTADRFMGTGWAALSIAALGVGMALLFGTSARFAFGTRAPGLRRDLARWFVGTSWATAALIGVTLWACAGANLDLADPAAAVLPGMTIPLALLAAVVAGVAGGRLAPPAPADAGEPAPVPATPLGSTEQISWSRPVSSPWLPIGGAVLVVAGIALAMTVQPAAGAVAAATGIAVVLLGHARVVVDRRGLTVPIGLLGLPRVHVPAEDIETVTVADVSATQFGGWGYRIVPGGLGVIVRSGPAVVVTRRSGQRVTVTVDDAETAAGLLAAVAAKAR